MPKPHRTKENAHWTPAAAQLAKSKPYSVQALQSRRVADIVAASSELGFALFHTNLSDLACTVPTAQKQLAEWLRLPTPALTKRDLLQEQLTNALLQDRPAAGYVFLLEKLPSSHEHSEVREVLLDCFADAAEFWEEKAIPFRCFHSAGRSVATPSSRALALVSPFSIGAAAIG
ncbi:barstar family protein [Ramlibacter humi]|uniref:Barstar (barnase inhibitor) domain-containing protein n=1 Tax=Ramlibacter humi TaxID=2530451 RepID=A0A4Z0BD08_9BURK|nr:hypothetical protein [Ramlibacter humi]TFY96650.1 hypothetical protein EZ216_19885 [Ramlibacter humi]